MENTNTKRSATWFHPSDTELLDLGVLTGHIEFDEWEGQDMFYPDEKFHAELYKRGFEPVAGFWLTEAKWAYVD